MKYIFRSRFSWFDGILIVSAYPLVATIGWWAILVLIILAALGAAISVKLGVHQ